MLIVDIEYRPVFLSLQSSVSLCDRRYFLKHFLYWQYWPCKVPIREYLLPQSDTDATENQYIYPDHI